MATESAARAQRVEWLGRVRDEILTSPLTPVDVDYLRGDLTTAQYVAWHRAWLAEIARRCKVGLDGLNGH